jgi:hypothetical protein
MVLRTVRELSMWKSVCHFLRRRAEPEDPLIEFEDGLLLIVDAEQ